MTVHVLAYAPKLQGLLLRNPRVATIVGGAGKRWLLLTGALAAGLLVAVLTAHTAHAWLPFLNKAGEAGG